MTGLFREVRRVRRAMEQFSAAWERADAFSVRLEDLPLLHAADSFALLTGTPGLDEQIARQMGQLDNASLPETEIATRMGRPGLSVEPQASIDRDCAEATVRDPRSPSLPWRVDGVLPTSKKSEPIEPRPEHTAVLAQRFEEAGLKTAWESAFRSTAEPLAAPAAVQSAGPALANSVSQQLLRSVERAERAGRSHAPVPGRSETVGRPMPMAVEDRQFVPPRPLTPAEAGTLRAAVAPATSSALGTNPPQAPGAEGVAQDRKWPAQIMDPPQAEIATPIQAVPRQRWQPPTGTGLRRLASLAGVLPSDPSRTASQPAPVFGEPLRPEWPLRQGNPAIDPEDFAARLEETLRAEAIRSGIPLEELIR
jgi:hypothetical protein